MRADILAPVGLWINSSFRFSVIIRVCKNECRSFKIIRLREGERTDRQTGGSREPSGPESKWKIACSSALIFVWIDARGARKPQSVRYDTTGRTYLRLFENVIFSWGFPSCLLSSLCVLLSRCHYHFPRRRIAIMLILTTRFIAPFRSSASMRRMKLRKNDGKSFRLRTTLPPSITLSLILYLRSPSLPSFFDGHT